MPISLTHKFTSLKTDGVDSTRVQPSNWNDEHDLEMASGRLLGRTAAGVGPAQEITPSADLSLDSATLGLSFPVTAYGKTLLDDADAGAARTTLGLGTMATQAATAVNIDGGTMDGVFIGETVPAIAVFSFAQVAATEFAAIDLRSNVANDNFKAVRLVRGLTAFAITIVNQLGVFVQTAYEISLNTAGAVSHSFRVGATERLRVDGAGTLVTGVLGTTGGIQTNATSSMESINPRSDNGFDLGNIITPLRWRTIFLVNSPSVSSDARLKENIADFTEADLAAARLIRGKTFSIRETGKPSSGLVAQQIIEAFTDAYVAAGLDGAAGALRPFDLGLISDGVHYSVCYELVNNLRIEALARNI